MQIFLIGIALIATGVLLRALTVSLARRAEAAYPPPGAFVTVEGCHLHYIQQGNGPPVVLLHGSDGFWQDYARVLEVSTDDGYELIAFDRPGHGYSEAPPRDGGRLDTQVRLLHGALQAMGITRPVLAAHSWSTALALAYALTYPQHVRGLVLLSPWAYPTSDPPPRLLYVARFFGPLLSHLLLTLTPLKRWLVRVNVKQAFAPAPVPTDYERMARALWQRWPQQVDVFLEENADAWARFPTLSTLYPAIRTPIVVVTGDSDAVIQAEHHAYRLHHEVKSSELVVLPHAGHELPHTHPEAVRDAIQHCLSETVDTRVVRTPDVAENAAIARASELVLRYGWNAAAYQILNPDLEHWFAPDGEAVVGYARRFRVRVAVGAPVCEASRLAEMTEQFEQDAAQQGEKVCWFGAATRLQSALKDRPPHATIVVGAQPVWNPTHWPEIVQNNASLRAQIQRAGNKGVTVSEWIAARAVGNPTLQRCLDEWLEDHPFPTLHFMTKPVTLDRLKDRRLFVAEVGGTPVAFLVATPVPSRNGWLIEQIARGRAAPNGTSERLVDATMRTLAEDEYTYITLGLVPLTRRGRTPPVPGRLWLRLMLAWIRAHGRRFYNFEGLDAFKAKFRPDHWEPIFALTNERHVSLRSLLAIAAAFSEGPLLWTLMRAFWSATEQEVDRLRHRLTTKTE
jgi:phosphatidylglycerol lysyltransferase